MTRYHYHQKNNYLQYLLRFRSNQEESTISQSLPKYNQDLQPKTSSYIKLSRMEHRYIRHILKALRISMTVKKFLSRASLTLKACISDRS
ncbi:rab3 GTPase-activating protein catalytic subunit [Trifolium repens]|nr:rab3 GTPase-activating protein catalytic subunit [Trifolium repens]